MESNRHGANTAIFFCQRIDPDQDAHRRPLEKELGQTIRFFPLPCSGRIEALHLLKALETGAEKVYLITCPEGDCKYRQGNLRGRKRLDYAKTLIREIGLSAECLETVPAAGPLPLSLDESVPEAPRARSAQTGQSKTDGRRRDAFFSETRKGVKHDNR